MEALLGEAKPNTFLVQARYEIGSTFEAALGIESHRNIYELRYAALVPDAIEVRPPRSFGFFVSACGNIRPLELGDDRLQLRPIDIKLTSEPSANYFAEVTYYTRAPASAIV